MSATVSASKYRASTRSLARRRWRATRSLSGFCRYPIEVLDRLLEHGNRYNRPRQSRTHLFGGIGPVAIVRDVGLALTDGIEDPAVRVPEWRVVPETDGPLDQAVRNDPG
jgi:hypothetical protein